MTHIAKISFITRSLAILVFGIITVTAMNKRGHLFPKPRASSQTMENKIQHYTNERNVMKQAKARKQLDNEVKQEHSLIWNQTLCQYVEVSCHNYLRALVVGIKKWEHVTMTLNDFAKKVARHGSPSDLEGCNAWVEKLENQRRSAEKLPGHVWDAKIKTFHPVEGWIVKQQAKLNELAKERVSKEKEQSEEYEYNEEIEAEYKGEWCKAYYRGPHTGGRANKRMIEWGDRHGRNTSCKLIKIRKKAKVSPNKTKQSESKEYEYNEEIQAIYDGEWCKAYYRGRLRNKPHRRIVEFANFIGMDTDTNLNMIRKKPKEKQLKDKIQQAGFFWNSEEKCYQHHVFFDHEKPNTTPIHVETSQANDLTSRLANSMTTPKKEEKTVSW